MVKRAFSLVEVLAAVAIIGIVTFLAIPNIIRIKSDGELSLAISRAEALNMAQASYLQAKGISTATNTWSALGDDNSKYVQLAPYVAFAPANLAAYMPNGYAVTFSGLTNKVTLWNTSGGSNVSSNAY